MEKIYTFGTPELDLEAFIVALNSQRFAFIKDWEIECNFKYSCKGCFLISETPWGVLALPIG